MSTQQDTAVPAPAPSAPVEDWWNYIADAPSDLLADARLTEARNRGVDLQSLLARTPA